MTGTITGIGPGWLIALGIVSIRLAIQILFYPAFEVVNLVLRTSLELVNLRISTIAHAFR